MSIKKIWGSLMISGFSRFFLISICALTFISVSQPVLAQTEEGFLQKWFPILFGDDNKPGPEDTLVAPFADNQQEKIRENSKSVPKLGSTEKPLDKLHIPHRELQEWVTQKVSTGMSFDDETFESTVTSLKPYFSQPALQEYINFLGQQGIYSKIIDDGMSLSSIISERPHLTYWDDSCPELTSEFIQNNRYHWRFDVSVIYGILDKNVVSYDQIDQRSGQDVAIHIVVQRVPYSDNSDGLKIVSWQRARAC